MPLCSFVAVVQRDSPLAVHATETTAIRWARAFRLVRTWGWPIESDRIIQRRATYLKNQAKSLSRLNEKAKSGMDGNVDDEYDSLLMELFYLSDDTEVPHPVVERRLLSTYLMLVSMRGSQAPPVSKADASDKQKKKEAGELVRLDAVQRMKQAEPRDESKSSSSPKTKKGGVSAGHKRKNMMRCAYSFICFPLGAGVILTFLPSVACAGLWISSPTASQSRRRC